MKKSSIKINQFFSYSIAGVSVTVNKIHKIDQGSLYYNVSPGSSFSIQIFTQILPEGEQTDNVSKDHALIKRLIKIINRKYFFILFKVYLSSNKKDSFEIILQLLEEKKIQF